MAYYNGNGMVYFNSYSLDVKVIIEKIADSVLNKEEQLVMEFDKSTNRQNQMLMLIKPEVFLSGKREEIICSLSMIIDMLVRYEIEIKGIYCFSGEELREKSILDKHYFMVDILSRQASKILTQDDRKKIYDLMDTFEKIPIYGAHEYLDLNKVATESSLRKEWDNRPIIKVRNGLYVQRHTGIDDDFILINGFYPEQYVHFTKPNRYTIALLINSDLPWKVLRRYMIGNTFPNMAVKGSLRQIFFSNALKYGIGKVDQFYNCVHLSAGPFEAMYEIFNIIQHVENVGSNLVDLNIVKILIEENVNLNIFKSPIHELEVMIGNQKYNLFDVTEEVDTYTAVKLYLKFLKDN